MKRHGNGFSHSLHLATAHYTLALPIAPAEACTDMQLTALYTLFNPVSLSRHAGALGLQEHARKLAQSKQ
jgi:hypothetical protein